jgi:hypothetical protein
MPQKLNLFNQSHHRHAQTRRAPAAPATPSATPSATPATHSAAHSAVLAAHSAAPAALVYPTIVSIEGIGRGRRKGCDFLTQLIAKWRRSNNDIPCGVLRNRHYNTTFRRSFLERLAQLQMAVDVMGSENPSVLFLETDLALGARMMIGSSQEENRIQQLLLCIPEHLRSKGYLMLEPWHEWGMDHYVRTSGLPAMVFPDVFTPGRSHTDEQNTVRVAVEFLMDAFSFRSNV